MRARNALVLAASALTPAMAIAQTAADVVKWADSARVAIEAAQRAGDLGRITSARQLVERALVANPNDPWLLHYQGYAIYREALRRENRDKQDVRQLRDRADSILERSAMLLPLAESHALRASLLGQMIGSNPIRGMTLGPRSGAEMNRAAELSPRNPRVFLMRGIGAIFTPKMFGGGDDKAEENLLKAIELFVGDKPTAPAPAWGHGEAYIWLGQLYAKQDKRDAALAAYNKALALEPDNAWLKTTLIPNLERKR
jgi:tetratricopeptide (TPR) repeat protein